MDEERRAWAELLWSEWKYRHTLYWKSFYLWGAAAVAVILAPLFRGEIADIGTAVYIFPVVGIALSWVGTWHLAAEYVRMRAVDKTLRKLQGDNTPDFPKDAIEQRSFLQHAVAASIGDTVTALFMVGFTALGIVTILLLSTIEPVVVIDWQAVAALVVIFNCGIHCASHIFIEPTQTQSVGNRAGEQRREPEQETQ